MNNTKLQINIRDGSLAGQRREITTGAITIGRSADCGLQFHPHSDRVVSTRHAVIQAESDGYYLIDQKSTNGTYINGVRVSRDRLKDGDLIQFGTQGPHAVITLLQQQFGQQIPNSPPRPAPAMPDPSMLHAAQLANEPELAELPQENNLRKSIANFGLYNPDKPSIAKKTGKHLGIAVALIAAVFMSLLVILLVHSEMGIRVGIMAAIIAFVPACFYVLPLLWLDRYDPEPPWALASAFAWGALVSIIISLIINSTVMVIFGEAAGMLVSAPIFEEASKGMGVLLVLLLLRREFDDIVDGIVYAGIIALGFATVENVFYYGRQYMELGQTGLEQTFIARGILSPFAHVIFTSMTGIGCGIARESHKWAVRILMPIAGYCLAVTLHAIWNTIASSEYFLIGYIIFEIPFFLLFLIFLFFIIRRERRILQEMLSAEVAMGLISTNQLQTATSSLKSLGWIISGVGIGKFNSRRRFLRTLAKLGLSYWHIQRATVAHGVTRSFSLSPILRGEVKKLRDTI